MDQKHILVPLDFSDDSIHALEHAIIYANKYGYNIRLIHVKRKNADYQPTYNLKDFDEVFRSGIADNFDNIINRYQNMLKGTFDYRIREGRIYSEICNQAKYGDSELIIMGTHGVSGFEEKWVGSNAFRIVSHASCPVITIRYDFPQRQIRKIVLPIDVSEQSRQKVPFITQLAITFNAEIHLIDIRDNNKAATRKTLENCIEHVSTFLKRRKVKFIHESLKGKNMSDIIIQYSLMIDADLIAVMTEKPEKTQTFWIGPFAQQMVNHSPISVISFRPNQKTY